MSRRSSDVAALCSTSVDAVPPEEVDLRSVLHVDLLLDAVASRLALTALTFLQRAAGKALLSRIKQAGSARHSVTAADVEAGDHVLVLRHLIASSTCQEITLPPAEFMLGCVADPRHVTRVRPTKPPFDEPNQERIVEWLEYVPEWRPGFGPVKLHRSVTLRAGTIGERSHERPRFYFVDAPHSSGAVIEVGSGPLCVALQGIDIYPCSEPLSCFYVGDHFRAEYHAALGLSTGGCRRCQTPKTRLGATCTCESFGGPVLEVSDCFINGGFDLRGRNSFSRCKFMQPENLHGGAGGYDRPTPWHRLTLFEQMNNVESKSYGDHTFARELNGKFSVVCTVTSQAPDGSGSLLEVSHDLIQNAWDMRFATEREALKFLGFPGKGFREGGGPRRRFDRNELRGPPLEEASLLPGSSARDECITDEE